MALLPVRDRTQDRFLATPGSICDKSLEGLERFIAHVVLDALGVGSCRRGRHSKRLEESDDGLMAGLGLDGEALPGVGKENRAIGLSRYQTVALEPLHGTDDRDMGHPEIARQVGRPRLPPLGQEVGDGLHVILRPLLGMLLACTALMEGALIAGGGQHG